MPTEPVNPKMIQAIATVFSVAIMLAVAAVVAAPVVHALIAEWRWAVA